MVSLRFVCADSWVVHDAGRLALWRAMRSDIAGSSGQRAGLNVGRKWTGRFSAAARCSAWLLLPLRAPPRMRVRWEAMVRGVFLGERASGFRRVR